MKEKHKKWAIENHLGHIDLEAEIELFKNHSKANGKKFEDYDAAFFVWLGRIEKMGGASKSDRAKNEPKFLPPVMEAK